MSEDQRILAFVDACGKVISAYDLGLLTAIEAKNQIITLTVAHLEEKD